MDVTRSSAACVKDVRLIAEYVDLYARLAAEALTSKEAEQRFCERLDQLWYAEMTEADRAEAQKRITTQGTRG
jgi:hypothetical protein